jgi:hypothetical protein
MYITNFAYYQNSGVAPTNANHGSYQYVSIADVVRNFMFAYVGPDKTIDNVDRSLVRFHAKQCVKTLNYDALKEIRAIEAFIGDDLKLVMPHDYVTYIRMSLLINGQLYPLSENLDAMSAKRYLYDNNNQLQFNGNGVVLYAATSELDSSRLSGNNSGLSAEDQCCIYEINNVMGNDPSRININPKFRLSKKAGVIDFDSTMNGQTIVIEYVSDGMEGGVDSEIMINKLVEQYVYAYVSEAILTTKASTPVMVKEDAKKKARSEYRNARHRLNKMNPSEILMTLRGQHKWIR